ncbi:MAG: hypothetical protein WB780_12165 [Candidatus Acidiferrales bacterium]
MNRRKRTWPVKFLMTRPTPQNPRGASQMSYAPEQPTGEEKVTGEEKANRSSCQFRNSVNSMNPKEKENF